MNTLTQDLFPETLLVDVIDGVPMTTSLKIAERFGRQHKDVLKIVRRVIEDSSEERGRRNFAPSSYLNKQRKRQLMYLITEEGFAIVAMSLTGKEALEWKWRFLEAFKDARRRLAAIKEREANALYAIRPRWKPIVEHPDMRRAELIGYTGHKSPASITACRRRMRQAGLLD